MSAFQSFVLALALFASKGNAEAASYDFSAHYQKQEVRIPMRDGVRLFTAIYTPKDTGHRYPFLMTRTPYSIGYYGPDQFPSKKFAASLAEFARSGFIFVWQDVRGRYMSEGTFVEERPEFDRPGNAHDVDESTDTYDTIEWLLKNVPNNNGKVGLRGISYPGFYTSTGLINAHPALVAASPQAPMADLYQGDDSYHNGAFLLLSNFDFYTDFGPQHNPVLSSESKPFDYGTKDAYKFFLRMGSIADADKLYGKSLNRYWTDVAENTTYDQYWRERNILPHLKHITPAVLVVGGWFDAEDLSGALKTYRAIHDQSPETDLRLVMGPWFHGQWANRQATRLGDVQFGSDTATYFREKVELPFFLHFLKGERDLTLPRASMFETGANTWQSQPQWPPSSSTVKPLYLHADHRLSFSRPTQDAAFDSYISDPANPVPFSPKPTLTVNRDYMVADQRFAGERSDVLSYETDPLQEPVTVAGPVSPSLYISSTGTDSDFVVKLIDVDPSGRQQLIRGEPFRAKFRRSFVTPEPLVPGQVEQIRFDMPDIYHCFQTGHRLMVQIQSSWFPLFDRNPQTLVDIPNAKPADFIKATERVYRSTATPTAIELCVVAGQ